MIACAVTDLPEPEFADQRHRAARPDAHRQVVDRLHPAGERAELDRQVADGQKVVGASGSAFQRVSSSLWGHGIADHAMTARRRSPSRHRSLIASAARQGHAQAARSSPRRKGRPPERGAAFSSAICHAFGEPGRRKLGFRNHGQQPLSARISARSRCSVSPFVSIGDDDRAHARAQDVHRRVVAGLRDRKRGSCEAAPGNRRGSARRSCARRPSLQAARNRRREGSARSGSARPVSGERRQRARVAALRRAVARRPRRRRLRRAPRPFRRSSSQCRRPLRHSRCADQVGDLARLRRKSRRTG